MFIEVGTLITGIILIIMGFLLDDTTSRVLSIVVGLCFVAVSYYLFKTSNDYQPTKDDYNKLYENDTARKNYTVPEEYQFINNNKKIADLSDMGDTLE